MLFDAHGRDMKSKTVDEIYVRCAGTVADKMRGEQSFDGGKIEALRGGTGDDA